MGDEQAGGLGDLVGKAKEFLSDQENVDKAKEFVTDERIEDVAEKVKGLAPDSLDGAIDSAADKAKGLND